MKVTNKTESHIKYADELFAPKEAKEIEAEKIYEHRDFEIEKEEKVEKIEKKKTKKKKGGKR